MKTKKSVILISWFGFLPVGLFGAPSEDAALNDSVAFREATRGTASSDVSFKTTDEKTKKAVFSNRRADGAKKTDRVAKKGGNKTNFKRSSKREAVDARKTATSAETPAVASVTSERKGKSSKLSKDAKASSEKRDNSLSKAEIEALKAKIDWNEPLPLSPAVHTGTLKNGMRYYIYPKKGDCDAISLRLLVNAGALMETDAEDGLAHFTEHMVFNGSKHFKPGELIPYFQENGMSFGGDTNAFTYFMHTCYKLDVPKNDEASLRKALTVLNDMGFEAMFFVKFLRSF